MALANQKLSLLNEDPRQTGRIYSVYPCPPIAVLHCYSPPLQGPTENGKIPKVKCANLFTIKPVFLFALVWCKQGRSGVKNAVIF